MKKNDDVIISVIVPVFNVSEFLKQCMDSIINQSFKNIEIICVNDGSTDDSLEILESYKKKDNRVIIINQINKGLSAARNTGIDIARGKYIGFVDSDDFIHKDMLKILYENIEKHNADVSICNFSYYYNEDKDVPNAEVYDFLIDNNFEFNRLLISDGVIRNNVWTRLYKRELFDDIRFHVGRIFEDVSFSTLLMKKINRAYYCDKVLYYYRQRDDSLSNLHDLSVIRDAMYNNYEKYLFVKEFYPELMDINVFSMLSWIGFRKNVFDKICKDDFYEIYSDVVKDVFSNNYYIDTIDKFSDFLEYDDVVKFVDSYKSYNIIHKKHNNSNNNILLINRFNKHLKDFDYYFELDDEENARKALDNIDSYIRNYNMFFEYKKRLELLINKYGQKK